MTDAKPVLDEILGRLRGMSPEEREEAKKTAAKSTENLVFVPNEGPQLMAYLSKADILLFGGQPGGGKTGLLNGLAINEHDRSLIVRKQFTDLEGVLASAKGIVGTSQDFVGGNRPQYNKPNGGVIHYQGIAPEDYDTSKQGNPHDLIGVDEGAQFTENQIRMLWGWCRTDKPKQRCRMVIASNPPLDSVGDWMVDFWGPWLNDKHPNPAKDGEIRWFIFNAEGKSQEVDGPETVVIDGVEYWPHSRTFISSSLKDNPYINLEDYRKRLQSTPEPYRSILLSGDFMSLRQDQDFQVIPTEWVVLAQARWTPNPPEGMAMTAMAIDPAGGGQDSEEIITRYGGWFSEPISTTGPTTADGSLSAGRVVQHRRDNCPVVVGMGGGYGGAVSLRLKDNIDDSLVIGFMEGATSLGKSREGKYQFANKRSEAIWRVREALDPNQDGGSVIALPPNAEIKSDLTAPTFKLTERGILVEPKIITKDGKIVGGLRKKLGRSPGKGDVVYLALSPGNQAVMKTKFKVQQGPIKAQLGYAHMKKGR